MKMEILDIGLSFLWVLGFRTQVLNLSGKCFKHWTISPVHGMLFYTLKEVINTRDPWEGSKTTITKSWRLSLPSYSLLPPAVHENHSIMLGSRLCPIKGLSQGCDSPCNFWNFEIIFLRNHTSFSLIILPQIHSFLFPILMITRKKKVFFFACV